jgi:hypothetical protein
MLSLQPVSETGYIGCDRGHFMTLTCVARWQVAQGPGSYQCDALQ